MKRFLCFILAIAYLIPGIAKSESIDYTIKSTIELESMLRQIQMELGRRINEDTIIIDEADIRVAITGRIYKENFTDYGDVHLDIVVTNKGQTIIDNLNCIVYVNNRECYTDSITSKYKILEPGYELYTDILFYLRYAGIESPYSLDEVKTIELRFYKGNSLMGPNYGDSVSYPHVVLSYDDGALSIIKK